MASVVVLTLAALGLGLLFLGRESFWLDEAYSVSFAQLGREDFWSLVTQREANMALYYFLLRGWISLGDGEVTVRLLSVLPWAASIPVFYLAAARLFDRRVAVVGSAFLTCNVFAIQFAQEARGYSLVMLLVVLSTYLFVRAVQEGRWPLWLGYTLVTVLGLYGHFFAGFVLLAHLASLGFLEPKSRPPWRTLVSTYGMVAILAAPLALFVLRTGGGQIAWVPPISADTAARTVAKLAGGRTPLVGILLLIAMTGLGLMAFRRLFSALKRSRRSAETHRLVLAVAWFIVPVGGAVLISVIKPIFVDRYLVVAIPGLSLIAGVGLVALKPRIAIAGFVVVLSLLTSQVALFHLRQDKDDWRSATAYILRETEEGDGVVFSRPAGRVPFGYYVEQFTEGQPAVDVPTPATELFDWRNARPGPLEVTGTEAIGTAAGSFHRIWLIVSPVKIGIDPGLESVLSQGFVPTKRRTFLDVHVTLYVRPPLR